MTGQPMNVNITTAVKTPDVRLCQRELTGKYAIKIVINHAKT
jgi:hypothetical protein